MNFFEKICGHNQLMVEAKIWKKKKKTKLLPYIFIKLLPYIFILKGFNGIIQHVLVNLQMENIPYTAQNSFSLITCHLHIIFLKQ